MAPYAMLASITRSLQAAGSFVAVQDAVALPRLLRARPGLDRAELAEVLTLYGGACITPPRQSRKSPRQSPQVAQDCDLSIAMRRRADDRLLP